MKKDNSASSPHLYFNKVLTWRLLKCIFTTSKLPKYFSSFSEFSHLAFCFHFTMEVKLELLCNPWGSLSTCVAFFSHVNNLPNLTFCNNFASCSWKYNLSRKPKFTIFNEKLKSLPLSSLHSDWKARAQKATEEKAKKAAWWFRWYMFFKKTKFNCGFKIFSRMKMFDTMFFGMETWILNVFANQKSWSQKLNSSNSSKKYMRIMEGIMPDCSQSCSLKTGTLHFRDCRV